MLCAAYVMPHWLLIASLVGYLFAMVAAAVLAVYTAGRAVDAAYRCAARLRSRRELRRAEWGSCDGLRAGRIRRLVDEHAAARRD